VKKIIPGLLLCCCVSSAHATDASQAYAIRGVGMLPCETYLQEMEKKSGTWFMIGGWLDGYVTATNRLASDTYDALSFETTDLVAGLLASHCKGHPKDPVAGVLNALLTKFQDDRLRTRSPRVKGKAGEQEFTLYAEVLQRVQSRLSALGLYQGTPEAEFGEKTREAVASFQRNNNLQPTGLPDQATLWRLLRKPDGSTALR
jgi:hypothetical protein